MPVLEAVDGYGRVWVRRRASREAECACVHACLGRHSQLERRQTTDRRRGALACLLGVCTPHLASRIPRAYSLSCIFEFGSAGWRVPDKVGSPREKDKVEEWMI